MPAVERASVILNINDTHFGFLFNPNPDCTDIPGLISPFERFLEPGDTVEEAAKRAVESRTSLINLKPQTLGSFEMSAGKDGLVHAFSVKPSIPYMMTEKNTGIVIAQHVDFSSLPLTPGTLSVIQAYKERGKKR